MTPAATISLGAAMAWTRRKPAAVAAPAHDAVARRTIVVGAGFEPRTTEVPCGVRVRLEVSRVVAGADGDGHVVMPSLGRLATFGPDGTAVIELGPLNPGEHVLLCCGSESRGVLMVAPRTG